MSAQLRITVDAEGLTSGGGRTWVRGVLEELSRDVHKADWTVRVAPGMRPGAGQNGGGGYRVEARPPRRTLARLAHQQTLRAAADEVWVHAANFGPVSQRGRFVLVAHNALHFSPTAGMGTRAQRLRAESVLARASVRAAAVTIVPSQAMADLVHETTGRICRVIPFGVRALQPRPPPPDDRFVFVHRTAWGPHKELGTLLEAVRLLGTRRPGEFLLWTASDPASRFARGFQESAGERELLRDSVVREHVRIRSFPDSSVPAGDAAVIPSSVESFCFPGAEAIFAGVPVIAADRAWARELFGSGARLVEGLDGAGFAESMEWVMDGELSPPVPEDRLRRLSWHEHVDGLRGTCRDLASAMSR